MLNLNEQASKFAYKNWSYARVCCSIQHRTAVTLKSTTQRSTLLADVCSYFYVMLSADMPCTFFHLNRNGTWQ